MVNGLVARSKRASVPYLLRTVEMDHLSPNNIPRHGKCLLVPCAFGNVSRLCAGGVTRER